MKARALLTALLTALLAAFAAACGAGEPPAPGATTDGSLGDRNGDAVLEPAPGEPLVDRTDLAPAARPGRTLATFAQISDPQVGDEESPARLPWLDRLGPPLTAAFRPQEALTAHVLDAALRSVNALRPQAVVFTGDLVENAQRNELDLLLAVLGGERAVPDSGRPGYDGPQDAGNADPLLYRPDVDPPRFPGLLGRAQRAFAARGLDTPWHPVVGNHDLLVQGVVRPTPATRRAAVGDRATVELDRDRDELPGTEAEVTPELVERLLRSGLPGRTERVAPDPAREPLAAAETLRRLRAASGSGGRGERMDYALDVGPHLRGLVLDLSRRDAGTGGRVLDEQMVWLDDQLGRAGRRRVVVFTHQPLASAEGGARALSILDRDRRVAAVVSGSTHRNEVRPRRTTAGGYWLISTSSLVDFPQQVRAFRLVETSPGRMALETWMLDHAGAGDTPAGASRALAFIDAQGGRPRGAAGRPADRNARLHLR